MKVSNTERINIDQLCIRENVYFFLLLSRVQLEFKY